MPPPSALNIKASSVTRLVKEEKSYHKELVQQTEKLKKMQQKQDNGEGDDEFKYEIKQQVCF